MIGLIALELPEGFKAEQIDKEMVRIIDPEHALSIYIAQTKEQNPEKAINDTWKKADPQFDAKVKSVDRNIPPEGFDDGARISYINNDMDSATFGNAKTTQGITYVLLVRGKAEQVDKRHAQIFAIFNGIKGKVDDYSKRPLTSITKNMAEFERFIKDVMEKSGIPGLSIAVVEDGKPVFVKGYGITSKNTPKPVDENTQMMIGSITKSMTTLLMGRLVDAKKFDWDTKIIDIYPQFRVADPDLTKNLTIENLVCACTGMPRKDLFMWARNIKDKSAEDRLFTMLKTLAPTTKLKETFQYQNQLVTTAGYMAAFADDPSKPMKQHYMELVQKHIFDPLHMMRTSFKPIDDNHAIEHAVDESNASIEVGDSVNKALEFDMPAGGVWSTARDMAEYLASEINTTDENVLHRRTPQVKTSHDESYALGWGIGQEKSLKTVGHAGGTYGFSSILNFYPDKNCGYVILANGSFVHAFEKAIADKLFELWFDTLPWWKRIFVKAQSKSDEVLKIALDAKNKMLKDFKEHLKDDPAFIDTFVGTHTSPDLGDYVISKKSGKYYLHLLDKEWELTAYLDASGKKVLRIKEPPIQWLELVPTDNGSFEIHEAQQRYPFTKK